MNSMISPTDPASTADLPSLAQQLAPVTAPRNPLDELLPRDRETILNRRLVRLDLRIRSQFDLISSRTGWLLTSHAFMLAAMGATLNAHLESPPPTYAWMRWFLLLALPMLGLLTSALVWRSVLAAYRIVSGLKNARADLLQVCHREFEYEQTILDDRDVQAGDLPPKVLPCALGAIWLVLFVLSILG